MCHVVSRLRNNKNKNFSFQERSWICMWSDAGKPHKHTHTHTPKSIYQIDKKTFISSFTKSITIYSNLIWFGTIESWERPRLLEKVLLYTIIIMAGKTFHLTCSFFRKKIFLRFYYLFFKDEPDRISEPKN